MNKQFKSQKITADIFRINEPWNNEGCNIFLFRRKKSCLIFDTGLGVFSLKNYLMKNGLNNFLVALTHSHFDHIGGISNFLGNEFAIPKSIKKTLHNKKYWCLRYLKKENFNQAMLNRIINKKAQQICKNFNIFIPNIIPIKTNSIKWFDYEFKLISLGGHSKDSCIYFEPKQKILVSGDLLYDGEIYSDCFSSNNKKFIKALNIISKLDFKIVLAGHGKILNQKQAKKIITKWLSILSERT